MLDVNCVGQSKVALERSVAALDAMVLLAAIAWLWPGAAQRQLPRHEVNLDVVAPETCDFNGDYVLCGRFEQIRSGNPTSRFGGPTAEALLELQQIAKRIPPCEGHRRIVARLLSLCYDP